MNPAEGALSLDHSTEPRLPQAKTAAAKSTRFHPTCFMRSPWLEERARSSHPVSLIYINRPGCCARNREVAERAPRAHRQGSHEPLAPSRAFGGTVLRDNVL